VIFQGRDAVSIENESLRVTVLSDGGHIAEILHKATGINPLWIPPWPTREPSTFDAAVHTRYGPGVDARLLAGIMGHNLCLDIFGIPSEEEAALGISVHGEASASRYSVQAAGNRLSMTATLPQVQIRVERALELRGSRVEIRESVESLCGFDRPIGWTQHATLGPPFLENGITVFEASATKSKVFDTQFGVDDYLKPGAEFDWPMAPKSTTGLADMSIFGHATPSSAFTAHLMDPSSVDAFFKATHPVLGLTFDYTWKRADFPWLGIWEENRSRQQAPWNGVTVARGMEFGVSPMPETRRQMVERGSLFGVPTFRWLPARSRLDVRYSAGFAT
jgi:hypothetical protein